MRLERRFRTTLYTVIVVLFGTGAAWLVIDRLKDAASFGEAWQKMSTYLLMLHGGAAMLFLMFLGALFATHVPAAWRSGYNHFAGIILIACNAVLIGTAFGLYYFGDETLREWATKIHTWVGLAFPAVVTAHVLLGRRRSQLAVAQKSPTRQAEVE